MVPVVGIDLGTTNSVVSVFRRGIAETIPVDGRSALPSVVSFREGGRVLVGQQAKAGLTIHPERTVSSAKRFMGDRSKTYEIDGKAFSPVDISNLVLQKLVESAQEFTGEKIRDAVITVPAYFTEAQREDTKRAGELAGLNVLRLVNEPTAAAIAYGLDKGKDQTLMVYDLGGGTFDVSILAVKGNDFEVKAIGGDGHLGGDDFDEAIVCWAAGQFLKSTGINILSDASREGKAVRQRLKEAAEAAKIELSQSESATLSIPDCLGKPLVLELTLTEYNALIAPMLQRTIDCMKSVLHDAKLRPTNIDRVILVGGSTRNRAVRQVVAREIKEPYTSDRVDEVVAHGAAILAANLHLPVPINVTDVTGHSLGVDVLDGEHNVVFRPIIAKQSVYPCRKGMIGSTNRPMQNVVEMSVFRGENINPQHNTCLGDLQLPVSPPQPTEVPIAAIFELDADGIIHFTAVQLPLIEQTLPILEHYDVTRELDMDAVDELVRSGKAQSKTVKVKS